jgi:sigma-B regulation protein RsbU (phosphoserine phosphatase)
MNINRNNTALDTALNELRLINDLDMAREVQQQLLPKGTREISGLDLAAECVPARELGGDFYDFLPYGNGRLALALGDVSGKGTAAALLGALAMGILRAHTLDHAGLPTEVLATLNDRIHAARLDARFVVMLFAVLDPCTRQLTLANAGNPYPFLIRNGRIEEIPVSGIPLGLMEGTRYEAVSLDLQLGDIVVFVSDGILECQNGQQEAFGAGRLAAVLTSLPQDDSAEDISSAILDATGVFSCNASALRDDRSLIVLRVTDELRADFSRLPVIY